MPNEIRGAQLLLTSILINPDQLLQQSAADGDVLTWNSSATQWEPQTPSGGGSTSLTIQDDGANDITGVDTINFGTSLTVTDNGSGKVTIQATNTSTVSVSDNGSQIVANASDINFSTNLNVVDDTDGTVTVSGLIDSIDDLSDVDTSTTAPTGGDVLTWNGTNNEWEPQASSGGTTTLAGLDDTVISNETIDQTIVYRPTQYGAVQQGWTYTGNTSSALVQDSQGFIYSADRGDTLIHKIDSSGNLVQSINPGYDFSYERVISLAIDSHDYLYSAGFGGGGHADVFKFDTNGNVIWSIHPGWYFQRMIIEASTFVEYLFVVSSAGQILKYNTSGTEITGENWPLSINAQAVASDGVGHVYAGTSDTNHSVIKYDLTGVAIWTFTNHTHIVNAIVADTFENVYSGDDNGTGGVIYKIDSNGNQVWSFTNHTAQITALALDNVGYLYSGSSDNTIRMIDTETGSEVYSFTAPTSTIDAIIYGQDYVYYAETNTVSQLERTGATAAAWVNVSNTLDSHADVEAATPSTNNVLTWTGSQWEPQSSTTSTITLDLADDGTNETTNLSEIATTNDTNSIFTHPVSDKLLIDVSVNWPQSDDTLAIGGNSVAVGTTPAGGDVLTWNGTNNEWEPQASSGGGVEPGRALLFSMMF